MFISQDNLKTAFMPIFVHELLRDGEDRFRFRVPSYQRGYRWGKKEVEELLDDLFSFVSGKNNQGSIYFLQPIVVRPIKEKGKLVWEVLDGQQRLTTILLILIKIVGRLASDDVDEYKMRLYEITYSTRPGMNFDNPDSNASLDAYHAAKAKETIATWVKKKLDGGYNSTVSNIARALFYPDNNKKVSFIWYSVPTDTEDNDSIALFNRLNKGKIKLTGSELVKALFILSLKNRNKAQSNASLLASGDQIDDSKIGNHNAVVINDCARFALEWDEIVRRLQNDSFWYFISDKRDVQTRMDTLLTFVTGSENDEDAYREFQKAYDVLVLGRNIDDFEFKYFEIREYKSFPELWEIITRGFDDLVRWYEDITAYNYVGWLVRCGKTLYDIKKVWDTKIADEQEPVTTDTHYNRLRMEMRECLTFSIDREKQYLDKENLEDLTYQHDRKLLERILLLFNVESARTSGVRFQFDRYSTEKWDVEHVASQEDNNLQKNDEKTLWIKFVLEVLSWMKDPKEEIEKLRDDGQRLKQKLEDNGSDTGNEFGTYYSRVVKFFSATGDGAAENKDYIGNLTLLDVGTNRSYKNAPFPYKRFRIIKREQGLEVENGKRKDNFVPSGTKNLFLKYYSALGNESSQIDLFRWSSRDQENYFNAICEKLSDFLKK